MGVDDSYLRKAYTYVV